MKDIELETIKLRLDGVKLAIARCRFAFLVAMIASIAIIATVWNAPMNSLIGYGILLAGIPAFFYWRRANAR